MKFSLTKLEADMLLNAAIRMESDDVWDEYTDVDSEALQSAMRKLGQQIADFEARHKSLPN